MIIWTYHENIADREAKKLNNGAVEYQKVEPADVIFTGKCAKAKEDLQRPQRSNLIREQALQVIPHLGRSEPGGGELHAGHR